MTAPLAGRHAIVTGAGRGLGAAIADALGALGARLTLMGRDTIRLEERARLVREAHRVDVGTERCDVSDERTVADAFARARERGGEAFVLVNNAGQAVSAPFLDTTREAWDAMLSINATSAFLCIRCVLPGMLEAGAGRIVNVSSTAGLKGYARTAAYAASKHALVGLTRALAVEIARRGVTVNAVCPGYSDTEIARAAQENLVASGRTPEEARRTLERLNPMGRLVRPEEVANAVAWLCSPGAESVTGQAIVVAGGELT